MARETIIQQGGRPVMLRRELVASIDELGEDVGLMAAQGLRKGHPDRVGVIDAVVAMVLRDARLRERLRQTVAPVVEELRQREDDKAARRQRSQGKRGRPRVSQDDGGAVAPARRRRTR